MNKGFVERSQSNRRRYRNFLLHPRYQLKYVVLVGGTALFLSAVNGTVFYFFTRQNYEALVDLAPMAPEAKDHLYRDLGVMSSYLALFSLSFSLFMCFLALVLSHRTVGPLYQFKKVFNEIVGGKLGARIRLRPHDDFRDVADAFNRAMDTLEAGKGARSGDREPGEGRGRAA